MRRPAFFLPLIISFVIAQPYLFAQNYLYGIGNQTWGINIPIENGFINVANGEVHIEIPLATLPQRGSLPLDERLVYDSRIWQIVPTESGYQFEPVNVPAAVSSSSYSPVICQNNPPGPCPPLNLPNSMAGWRFVAGNEVGLIQQNLEYSGTLDSYSYYYWSWTDPSGTTHQFPFYTGTQYCPSCGPENTYGYAVDGSGYFMNVTNYQDATVFDATGTEIFPAVIDRNGNTFTSNSNGALVDTLGRTPVTQSTNGDTTTYSVLTIGGATKTYTITTETLNVNTAFDQLTVNEYSGTLTAIHSIELPDGSSYTFNYDSGTSSGHYGELESITLPTGGIVTLGYQNYLDSYQNENRWLSSYEGGNGSYSFTPQVVTQCSGSNEVGCQEKMTAMDGNGNTVVYQLTLNNGAWNSQLDYYNGSSTHILSTATNYNFTTPCTAWWCTGAEWVTASTTTTTLSDTGQVATTNYQYGQPWSSSPTVVQMWDYNVSTSSNPSKEIDYSYDYTVNGANFLTGVDVKTASTYPNVVSQTEYEYDGEDQYNGQYLVSPAACPSTSVQSAGSLPNLIGAPGARGNLTCAFSGIGSNPSNGVYTSATYDSAGMLLSSTDANNNTTTYSNMCSDAYTQTVTYPVTVNGSNLQTSTAYDCSSGLLTSANDMNRNPTTYSYFISGADIGRLQEVTFPDTGSTTYSYPSALEVDTTTAQNSSSNVISKSIRDTYGRPYQTIAVAPEGNISSETSYNAQGRPYCVTNPHLQGTSSPTDGQTCVSYDVLGRPTQTSYPDGGSLTYTYSGPTVSISGGPTYTYNAFHDLLSVVESPGWETDYQYSNGLDEITEVDQWGGPKGSTSPGDRQRLFAYDSLGRKTAEWIPEDQSSTSQASVSCPSASSGSWTGPWTECSTLDGNGNVTQSTNNAGNVLNYQYDALNRPTLEWSSSGSFGYSYAYDGTDGYSHTNALGNLTYSTNPYTGNVGSVYSYDTMNRLNKEQVCVPGDCYYSTAETYDTGQVTVSVQASPGACQGTASYGQNSSTSSLASALAASINSSCSVVSARVEAGSSLVMQSTSSGTAYDYSFTTTAQSNDPAVFTPASFSLTSSGSPMTTNSYPTVALTVTGAEQVNSSGTYDSGYLQVVLTSSALNYSCAPTTNTYGQGSTTVSIAASLATAINSHCSSSYLSAAVSQADSSVVIVTSKVLASGGGNFSVGVGGTSLAGFSPPSFILTTSASTMTNYATGNLIFSWQTNNPTAYLSITGAEEEHGSTWDSGTISGSIKNSSGSVLCQFSASYGQNSNVQSIITSLASGINSGACAPLVTASGTEFAQNTGYLLVTSNTAGTASDYGVQIAVSSNDGFSPPSFATSPSTTTMAADGVYFSSGELLAEIQGPSGSCYPSASLQSGSTPSSLASSLASSVNSSCSSMVSAVASGSAVMLTSTTQGTTEDYTIIPIWEGMLPYNSFALTTSGPTMIGGTANYATATIDVTGAENSLGAITVSAGYDLSGNLLSLTYPDGNVVQQTFDSANRMNSVSYSSQGSIYSVSTFAPPGEPTYAYLGGWRNVTSSYNSAQNMTSLAYAFNGSSPFWSKSLDWVPTYSPYGSESLTQEVDNITGNVRRFYTDSLNRLTGVVDYTSNGNLLSGGANEGYSYDPFGNLTQSGNFGFSQSFNAFNQISGYSYDANGNQNTDMWGHALVYDPNGMLSSVAGGQETYTYEAQGNRAEVNGATKTDYVYFNGVPIAMLNGGFYTDLIYAGNTPVAAYVDANTSSGYPMYQITDQEGTLVGEGPNGMINWVNYMPYGQTLSGSTTSPYSFDGLQNSYTFAGLGWDPTTSMWHAMARQFSPQQGRWMSPDPYAGSYDWTDPQSLNRYAYVGGRPMYAIDQSGLDDGCGWVCDIPPIDILCLIFCDLGGGGGRPTLHGSLKPRPSANPWDDKFGVPYPGLTGGFEEAAGLPTLGDVDCDPFCGAAPAGGNAPSIDYAWWAGLGAGLGRLAWQHMVGNDQDYLQSQVDAWNRGYYSCVGKGLAGGVTPPLVTHTLGVIATNATESAAPKIAGTIYHFTDGRFTAWGKYSKVLVPGRAATIAKWANRLDVAGWALFDYELVKTIGECKGIVM